MKKYLILALLLLAGNASAFTFPWEKLKPELNLLKADIAKTADAVVKADVKVGENMKSLADVKAQVGDIEAKLNAQGNAIAGFNNKVSNLSSGRDTIQTTNNDSEVWRDLNNVFKAIILALLVQMVALIRFTATMYEKVIARMQMEMTRILTSKDKKEDKIDDFQELLIKHSFGITDTAGKREVERLLKESDAEIKSREV